MTGSCCTRLVRVAWAGSLARGIANSAASGPVVVAEGGRSAGKVVSYGQAADGSIRSQGLRAGGWAETLRVSEEGKNEGRCGGRGSRTYRRTLPAANGLSRVFDDLGRLNGGHIVADSTPDSLNPYGAGNQRYPLTKGRYGSYPRISPSTPYHWSDSRAAFNGLAESSVPP